MEIISSIRIVGEKVGQEPRCHVPRTNRLIICFMAEPQIKNIFVVVFFSSQNIYCIVLLELIH